ncbi:MAG: Hsp70 family protein [Micromonosporaceae bacterium]
MCAARRPSVGVDFGTSTTLVASRRIVVPIGNDSTVPWMPSLVGYDDDGTLVTGERAQTVHHGRLVRSIKRSITDGRSFVRVDLPTGAKDVRIDDLVVELLREAGRRGARRGQDVGVGRLVRLGCPAMWNGQQRRRLLGAAQRADLPVVLATMVDEPVAAGIAWLTHQELDPDRPLRIVVFDMGGGTLDIAVLDVRGAEHKDVTVLAATGIPEAGDALDDAIAVDLDLQLAKAGIDIDALDHQARARARVWLPEAARGAKMALSTDEEHPIVVPPHIFGRAAEVWYTREQLNEAFLPQLERAEDAVGMALRIAQITALAGSAHEIARMPMDALVQGVDVVLLSGGMCRIPYVRQRLEWLFESPTRVELAMDPPENAVVVGLARAGDYGRINMFRPSFDVLLEWDRGREFRTVYEAFTPLVERQQIRGDGTDLCYTRDGSALSLPRRGKGRLRVVSHSGERLRATLSGRNLDGFPVALSEETFEFSIYPDGRIRMSDGAGVVEGRIEAWHRLDPD